MSDGNVSLLLNVSQDNFNSIYNTAKGFIMKSAWQSIFCDPEQPFQHGQV